MQDIKYIRMTSSNHLEISNRNYWTIEIYLNKSRANDKRSFIDNPYLFLVTRLVYNYTHSGLITLVIQGYKIHNQFSENCYWLVIRSTVQRFLRRGCSNWGLVVPPGLKPSRLHVPNRSGFWASFWQGNLGDKNRSNSLVTWAKWSNDAMITISF